MVFSLPASFLPPCLTPFFPTAWDNGDVEIHYEYVVNYGSQHLNSEWSCGFRKRKMCFFFFFFFCGNLNGMVENMIILLLTATEFMWCWLGYLPRYFVCIHSLRMHHHLAQLVGFLWFDVRRCRGLSAVTKSVGAQLSALKHPKVLRTLRIFLWGIVKLPINIG